MIDPTKAQKDAVEATVKFFSENPGPFDAEKKARLETAAEGDGPARRQLDRLLTEADRICEALDAKAEASPNSKAMYDSCLLYTFASNLESAADHLERLLRTLQKDHPELKP